MKLDEFADLEISLNRSGQEAGAAAYTADFRFNLPGSEAETRLGQARPALVTFDAEKLRACSNWTQYGQELARQLFAPEVSLAFGKARAAAGSRGIPLRLRLAIAQNAPELHALRWETLADPETSALLCTSQGLLFSRYLGSADWRPVTLRPRSELRALAVIAAPSDLETKFHLPPLDAAAELATLRRGLGTIALDTLPGSAPGRRARLEDIEATLRETSYDILYLVCHGRNTPEGTILLLEDEQGQSVIVPGKALVARIADLASRPCLIVLVACESAGTGRENTLSTLGPLLAEAGIPAVIAMQSAVYFNTVSEFIPVFFQELNRDGLVDRAIAAARSAVRAQEDAWVPVLFMRLKTGRLWYVPGFSEAGGSADVWPRLMLRLKSYLTRPARPDAVTPVIGHGLVEPVLGSLSQIAQRWAESHGYPMEAHQRDDLPQVAQYLAINQDRLFPFQNLEETLRAGLALRFASLFPAGADTQTLDSLIETVGAQQRKTPTEAHRVLASLPLTIYLTANPDRLMEAALEEAGRKPEVVLCPWFRDSDQMETVYDREKYIPSRERPLVYHLYGRLDVPESVVLTEDDYFDYLMGISSNKERIPKDVLRALAASTLLFIGFQLEDWNFRVLLRSVMALADESFDRRPANIAAQIEPDETRMLAPGRARSYIEQYFNQDAKISLYWGSVDDFVEEFQRRWTEGS